MKNLGFIVLLMISVAHAKPFTKEIFESMLITIKKKSYYNLTDDEIYKSAIEGVLKKLESKNRKSEKSLGFNEDANLLLPPQNVKEMKNEMKGEVSGIGVGIKYDKRGGQVYPALVNIIKNGGAFNAGLLLGDKILKIDDVSVSELKSFKDIVYKIRGKRGTSVKLSLLRKGEVFNKIVKRKKIIWDAVEVSENNGNSKNYFLVKVNYFNELTFSALERELHRMKSLKIRSLILDLRGNTGGLFEEGLKVIKLFAKKGETVLLAKYGKGELKKIKAERNGLGRKFKIVVLISKDTKSMGEAFASTLKKINGATIIGERSYGKGTMEAVMSLYNDYSIKFTVGRLFTSDDMTWDKSGVFPDITMPNLFSKDKIDQQLELAKLLVEKE